LEIAATLWAYNICAEYLHQPPSTSANASVFSLDELDWYCKSTGIPYMLIVKEKSTTVKIKSVELSTEFEAPLQDIGESVTKLFANNLKPSEESSLAESTNESSGNMGNNASNSIVNLSVRMEIIGKNLAGKAEKKKICDHAERVISKAARQVLSSFSVSSTSRGVSAVVNGIAVEMSISEVRDVLTYLYESMISRHPNKQGIRSLLNKHPKRKELINELIDCLKRKGWAQEGDKPMTYLFSIVDSKCEMLFTKSS